MCIKINEAEINKRMRNKKFPWNGFFLSAQSKNLFPCVKHLIKKALKLSGAFF